MNIKSIPFFILISSGLLNAAVVPGRWEKVDGLQEGTQIVVEMKSGNRLEGAFKGSSPQDLTVTDPAGSDRQVPKTAVAKIMTAEKVKDGLSNGMLIGMGVGTGVAVGAVAIRAGRLSDLEECSACGLAIFSPVSPVDGPWALLLTPSTTGRKCFTKLPDGLAKDLHPLRDDPRFHDLLRRMNLMP